uniref:Uncharacterized protein n=1 Tax=Pseudo-nitzschia australis TaxID=44445 RepID=A0A7S4AMJ4_9STRA
MASANSVMSDIGEARYRQYHSKSVKDYIAKADLKPIIGNVTSIDVDDFRETVAQALSKITSRYTKNVAMYAGYSFLVESELGFQLRCRDPTLKLPPPQPFPKKARTETTTTKKLYEQEQDSYAIQHDCNVAVCKLVDEKFPGLLKNKTTPGIKSFNGVFTAREAFDHLEGEVGCTAAANDKYVTHLENIFQRKYIPEQNGVTSYFTAIDHDRYKAYNTKVSTIPIETSMVVAQRAFRAAVDNHKMQDIKNSWALIESTNKTEFKDNAVKYKEFKEHFTLHLRQLVLNVNKKKQPHPQAHVVESHSDMLAHMQDAMQTMVEEHNELREQYAHMVDTAHTNNRGPPSVVTTTSTNSNTGTSSNSANTAVPQMSYNDIQEMIKQALQGVAPVGNTPTTSSNLQHQQQYQRPKKWRQWRSWCYSCGFNLTHNSIDCKRPK